MDRIALDVVIDLAEIPAFQERIRIDLDGNGGVEDDERLAAREPECNALTPKLGLRADGAALALRLTAAGLDFPAGAGGVPTMRLVCEYEAVAASPLIGGQAITFADTSYPERIGWREIVVLGDSVAIGGARGGAAPTSTDVSKRLTAYPKELLTQPLDVRSVAFTASAGGTGLPPFEAPDAEPLTGTGPSPGASPGASPVPSGAGSPSPTATSGPAAVPGGVGGDIPAIFQATDLTPLVALGSILLAMALGAGHALTPGHGKTLMAAYLVGTRGTIRHAAGLGLAVTVSHTLGILALALLITGAETALPADVVVRIVPVVAALAFVAIGASMLIAEIRRRRRGAALLALAHHDDHDHDHDHDHDAGHSEDQEQAPAGEHSHGVVRHSHLPSDDRILSWRNLFALGLAGGIIPSTNALIILLGTIVVGRAAFGVVLVVAFGLGMAVVLGGVGALMVLARERMARLPSSHAIGRAARHAPLVASVAVLGIGLWLTAQAVSGTTVL